MKKKIANLIAAIIVTILGTLLVLPTPTYADDLCSSPTVPQSVKDANGCTSSGNVEHVVGNIISAIIGILGIVAVVFIVIGGIQYMTSAGDSAKTKKAKDTILYACIGLAVAALAFAITQFAINAINGSTTPSCTSGTTYDPTTGTCI